MKIALIGGCFDPPHNSHNLLAETLSSMYEEVWLLPAFKSLYGKPVSPFENRVAMCKLIAHDNIKVSEWEKGLSGTTYDLLSKLIATYSEHQFTFVIGTDNALKISNWYRGEEVIKLCPFCVFYRKGYSNPKIDWYKKPPHTFLTLELDDISSTQVRQIIRRMNPEVLRYALECKLYN